MALTWCINILLIWGRKIQEMNAVALGFHIWTGQLHILKSHGQLVGSVIVGSHMHI